ALAFTVSALQSGCAAADTPGPIDDAALHRHISVLASDEFGGRWPGSAGEKLTLDYLQRAFTAAGAVAGSEAGFLQPVPLVSWNFEVEPEFSVRGKEFAADL